MLRWKDRTDDGRASVLELVEEFRTFVRPTWKPTLSSFCTQLTSIAQVGPRYIPFLADLNELSVASRYCTAIPRSVGQTRGVSGQEWAHRRKDGATACTVLLV